MGPTWVSAAQLNAPMLQIRTGSRRGLGTGRTGVTRATGSSVVDPFEAALETPRTDRSEPQPPRRTLRRWGALPTPAFVLVEPRGVVGGLDDGDTMVGPPIDGGGGRGKASRPVPVPSPRGSWLPMCLLLLLALAHAAEPTWATVPLHDRPFGNTLGLVRTSPDAVDPATSAALWFTTDATLILRKGKVERLPAPPDGERMVDHALSSVATRPEEGGQWRIHRIDGQASSAAVPSGCDWTNPTPYRAGFVAICSDRIAFVTHEGEQWSVPHEAGPNTQVVARGPTVAVLHSDSRDAAELVVVRTTPAPVVSTQLTLPSDVASTDPIAVDVSGTWLAISHFGLLYRVRNLETGDALWATFDHPPRGIRGFGPGSAPLRVVDDTVAARLLDEAREWLRRDEDLLSLAQREGVLAIELPVFPSSADGRTWTWPESFTPAWRAQTLSERGPVGSLGADGSQRGGPRAAGVGLVDLPDDGVWTRWDLRTGTFRGVVDAPDPRPPRELSDFLCFPGADPSVATVKRRTGAGETLWRTELSGAEPSARCTTTLHAQTTLVHIADTLWALDAETGEVLARVPIDAEELQPGPSSSTVTLVEGDFVRVRDTRSLEARHTARLPKKHPAVDHTWMLPEGRGVLVRYVDGTAQVVQLPDRLQSRP